MNHAFATFRLIGVTLLLLFAAATPARDPEAVAVIDWNRTEGTINRGIFSTQGSMQVYVEPDPMVMQTFALTNPKGTQTRLETYIHQMEPENDNDDPQVFDWSRLHPDTMIRFINDRKDFEAVTDRLGMEPLSLLCYNAPWLLSDDPKNPITSLPEWAEFAAAVVESYNGRGETYRPNLRYVEIWNEPNMESFYTGTMKSYFDLFNTTAARIHRDYPGVMVGGPALTHAWHCQPEEWMDAFLKGPAKNADFISWHHYGPQGEPVAVLMKALDERVERFRQIPGKENGKAMITEIDAWYSGWPKIQHMMERQFRFLDRSDKLLSVHHFCCMAYDESGNYVFGIVDENGGIIDGTFWPYWLFRNLIGGNAYNLRQSKRAASFDLIASRDDEGPSQIATAVFHNKTDAELPIRTLLYFPPSGTDRVLAFDRVQENFRGTEKVKLIPAGMEQTELALNLAPGEALALNLYTPGQRHFPFRDMLNQQGPAIGLTAEKSELSLREQARLHVRVLNTTMTPVSGTIRIGGLPADWSLELESGSDKLDGLPFGEIAEMIFRFNVTSLPPKAQASPYAWLDTGAASAPLTKDNVDTVTHSIPATMKVISPLEIRILPAPVYTLPGEANSVTIQLRNTSEQEVSGSLTFIAPDSVQPGDVPNAFIVPAGAMRRFEFPFTVSKDAATGAPQGSIKINFLDVHKAEQFTLKVAAGEQSHEGTPLDLTKWLNFDPVSSFGDRLAYDRDQMGAFAYPADYTPSSTIARSHGIPFRFASMEDRHKGAILPLGQRIDITPATVRSIALLGFGHDGKHPGTWTLHYADGSSEKIESQIPEWCSPPPSAQFVEAFNAPFRYMEGGPAGPECQLWAWELKADHGKQLTAIELPTLKNAYLFAITLLP